MRTFQTDCRSGDGVYDTRTGNGRENATNAIDQKRTKSLDRQPINQIRLSAFICGNVGFIRGQNINDTFTIIRKGNHKSSMCARAAHRTRELFVKSRPCWLDREICAIRKPVAMADPVFPAELLRFGRAADYFGTTVFLGGSCKRRKIMWPRFLHTGLPTSAPAEMQKIRPCSRD